MNAPEYSLEACISRCFRLAEAAKARAEDFERAGPPFSPTVALEEERFFAALVRHLRRGTR